MNVEEYEEMLAELEGKLERVRVLYDQYFMGYERMEPSTLRREVERDFWLLRKENIRNTAARYRMQMLSQRYQVLQQYWGRTVRDIENGTYKRDLKKALERFGDAAANTYAGKKWKERVERGLAKKADREKQLAETVATLEAERAAEAKAAAERAAAEAKEAAERAAAEAKEAERAGGEPASDGTPRAQPSARGPVTPRPSIGMPAARPSSSFAAQAAAYRSSLGSAPSTKLQAAAPVSMPPPPPSMPPPPPESEPPPPRGALPTLPDGAAGLPPAQGRTPPPPRAIPNVPPTPRPPPAAPAAFAADGSASEARLQQIYAQYVAARQTRNESAATVSYEALAKSLRDSLPKLREKAGSRAIDFEVTEKDGRTILKPIVR